MSGIPRRVLLVAIAFAVAVSGGFGLQSMTRSRSPLIPLPIADEARPDLPPLPHGPLTDQMLKDAEEDGVVDLYGNEVTPAVATYTFDDRGTLYEVHSPQTEVPRLGSPKS